MKIRSKGYKSKRVTENSVPNMMAFGFIRNFLTDREYESLREEYLIGNLNKKQVNQLMSDVKWLFKNYKGLDVLMIEEANGSVSKFIL
ncbi:MAG: hypothetical protein ACRDD7_04360 [Peptostreptococcaceae bacterium]